MFDSQSPNTAEIVLRAVASAQLAFIDMRYADTLEAQSLALFAAAEHIMAIVDALTDRQAYAALACTVVAEIKDLAVRHASTATPAQLEAYELSHKAVISSVRAACAAEIAAVEPNARGGAA